MNHNERWEAYDDLKAKGWLIRKSGGGLWTVTHGLKAWGGFHEWNDALAFAIEESKAAA